MIRYDVIPADPAGHVLEIKCTIPQPDASGQQLKLPAWIPGSYLIRDFAKHIVQIGALCKGEPVGIWPTAKDSWQCAPCKDKLEVFYQVYANDLSVRGAHFDQHHCFFNGTSVFLQVMGQLDAPCEVVLHPTPHMLADAWTVATTLKPVAIEENGFGGYRAENYWDLIEHPVEMGQLQWLAFEACGIPHKMAIYGQGRFDLERIAKDLKPICEAQINLFGEAPFEQYLFLVTVTKDGYGGLEHPDSTALLASRDMLPHAYMGEKPDARYLEFLELCSHEYFHAWNVKRIQPACYQKCDLSQPVYTHLLWWFEGATSYYDAWFLYRAGIIDETTYLDTLAKQLTRVWRMPGRHLQSVAESSLLTWTKFYQQDENAPNAIISYYSKGAAIVLGLDLLIRKYTQGKKSLDDLLKQLWQHYGKPGIGIEHDTIEILASELAGHNLHEYFQKTLYDTEDVPLAELFPYFGIDFKLRPASHMKDLGGTADTTRFPPNLGIQAKTTAHNTVQLTHVWHERPAYYAGLSAGDELIALDGLRVESISDLENALKQYAPGETIELTYFRRDELNTTLVTLDEPPADRVVLTRTHTDRLTWP